MATRSVIAHEWRGGAVSAAYCHMDGCPEGAGMHLLTYYPTRRDSAELVMGGSMTAPGIFHLQDGEDWEAVRPRTWRDRAEFERAAIDFWDGTQYVYLMTAAGVWEVAEAVTDWEREWGDPKRRTLYDFQPVGDAMENVLTELAATAPMDVSKAARRLALAGGSEPQIELVPRRRSAVNR